MTTVQPIDASRLALILDQLDAFPTLGPVAARVLELTAADDFAAAEVIAIISSDPALSARVLRLCRCSDAGRAHDPRTVAHAAKLMGMEAVRCAVLSTQVFDVMDAAARAAGTQTGESPVFNRAMFWRHCIATALVSERLAASLQGNSAFAGGSPGTRVLQPAEAFLAGMLHDLGHLALHVILPRSFDEVCAMAEDHAADLEQSCTTLIGISPSQAGQRLAERWQLPDHVIAAVAAGLPRPVDHAQGRPGAAHANGHTPPALNPISNRGAAAIVGFADSLVRSQHITITGHGLNGGPAAQLPGVEPGVVSSITNSLHEDVAERCDALGMNTAAPTELLLQSITRANEVLARFHFLAQQRSEALCRTQAQLSRQALLASIGQIAAGAAHEMNNPLTVISGRSQLLSERLQDPELASMVTQITEAAHQLSDLVTALRETTQPGRPVRASVDLNQIVQGLAREFSPRMPEGVRLTVNVQSDLPTVWMDGDQITEAMRELLCNALQAPAERQIELRVQIDRLDDRLIIRIADDGPGLSEDALIHSFDPFFSAKSAGRRPGLGLAQVRRVVEAHGGTVTLENSAAPGAHGAVATIALSRWRRPDEAGTGQAKALAGAGGVERARP